MTVLAKLISLIIGYAFGSISPAYFFAKSKGRNIKDVGSGNAGTTNITRAFGKKAGALVFVCDFLKAVIACLLCVILFGDIQVLYTDLGNKLIVSYASLGIVLGHCFPFYLKFKGGKGVVAALGSMLILDYISAIFALAVFIIVVVSTKYVSLGSIIAAILFLVLFYIFNSSVVFSLILNFSQPSGSIEPSIIVTIMILIIVLKHKSNIKRLIRRKEPRINIGKKRRKK